MGSDRRRVATGPEHRRSRRLCTLERLEPRCVLSASTVWPAPPILPVAHGRADIMASDLVAPTSSSDVVPLMKSDAGLLTAHSHTSPYLDVNNEGSLVPTDTFNLPKDHYQTIIILTVSDPGEGAFWDGYFAGHGIDTTLILDQSDGVSIDWSSKAPSDYDQSAPPGNSQTLPPGYVEPSTSSQFGYPSNASSSGDSTRGSHNTGPDSSLPESTPSGPRAVANVSALSSEATPASAVSIASAAQSHESRDVGRVTQVGRSSVFDSSAAGQFNSAAVTATSATGDSSLGQTTSVLKADQQAAVNQALAGLRILSGAEAQGNAAQLAAHSLSTGEAVQLLEGKAALAALPLDLRRMEQALETVVSEVKSIGPEVARWFDGVHAVPVTIAIAAAAVAGGSIYYWRRRKTRRLDRPEDEASSSWLFARLQPTPE